MGTACARILAEYKQAKGRPMNRALYRRSNSELTTEEFEIIQAAIRADVDELSSLRYDKTE